MKEIERIFYENVRMFGNIDGIFQCGQSGPYQRLLDVRRSIQRSKEVSEIANTRDGQINSFVLSGNAHNSE